MTSNLQNTLLGCANVYVNGEFVGLVDSAEINISATRAPYYSGYPATLRGYELTSSSSSISFKTLEITAKNLRRFIPGANITEDASGVISWGLATSATVQNLQIVKRDSISRLYFVATIWKAQLETDFAISFSQNTEDFIAIEGTFRALNDSVTHPDRPLGIIQTDLLNFTPGQV